MPSNMIRMVDQPPVLGMNTFDDANTLKDGECVRLLNAFPGNPPIMIPGSISTMLTASGDFRFVPPGISINFSGTNYVIVWAQAGGLYSDIYALLSLDKDTAGSFNILGYGRFASPPLFGLIELFGCVYCTMYSALTQWKLSGQPSGTDIKALGMKVVESPIIVRDMCIVEPGIVATGTGEFPYEVLYLKNDAIIPERIGLQSISSTGVYPQYYDYAFQYVRHNDSTYFEAGGTPAGMILPPGITAGYKPQRMDTFLPGVCVGAGLVANRKTVEITGAYKDFVAYNATGGFTGAHVVTARAFDNDYVNKFFDVNSVSSGSTISFLEGSGYKSDVIKFGLWMSDSGCTATFDVEYGVDSVWYPLATGFNPINFGWNTVELAVVPGNPEPIHTYYRIRLTNSPGASEPYCTEACFYRAFGTAFFTMETTRQAYAIAQGATHLRVTRTRAYNTGVLAEGATHLFVCDLPLLLTATTNKDYLTDGALGGETNQLIEGYSESPNGAFIEYVKGRAFIETQTGKTYFSEVPGGDGGTDQNLAEAYPQLWASLFKPLTFYLDCDAADGQKGTGIRRLDNDLFLLKERKAFALFGGDPTVTALTLISYETGCAFPYTLISVEMQALFEKCLFFMSNNGPAVIVSGGRIRVLGEFKIRELWPTRSAELYGKLDSDYQWMVQNCSAAYFKDALWVMYVYRVLIEDSWVFTSRVFGYYLEPTLISDNSAAHGPFEFQFADPTYTPPVPGGSGSIVFRQSDGAILFRESDGAGLFTV